MVLLGTIFLWIGLVFLGLLLLLLFLPIRFRGGVDQGEAWARVRFGPVKVPLYPPPKDEGESGAEPPKKQKKQPVRAKKEKEKKPFRPTREQIFYALEALPPILGRALRRTRRRVRIAPLKVYVLVAGTDPADTAVLYGRLSAALAAGLPALHRLVRIREQDIRLYPDFQREEMDLIADVGVSIRLWDLLAIGLCAGASLLKCFIKLRRMGNEPQRGGKTGPKTAGEAGAA